MSQAFAEIRHFQKCLVISGKDYAIEEFSELPRHLQTLFVFFVMYAEVVTFVAGSLEAGGLPGYP